MPWHVARAGGCPPSMPFAVIKDSDGSVEACHSTRDGAERHMAALYANEPKARTAEGTRSMDGTLYRTFEPELHVRSGGDGRTIYGIAVPYRRPVQIDDRLTEQFAPGAFNHQLRSRVKFAREHIPLGGTLIGATSLLRDDPAGLYFEARAARTPAGDETVELVREGALNHVSIGFRERQNRRLPGGITERVTADLTEIAMTMEGAYGDLATAVGVRSRMPDINPQRVALLAQAEEYLYGLPTLVDHDLEIRALRLGLKLPAG